MGERSREQLANPQSPGEWPSQCGLCVGCVCRCVCVHACLCIVVNNSVRDHCYFKNVSVSYCVVLDLLLLLLLLLFLLLFTRATLC